MAPYDRVYGFGHLLRTEISSVILRSFRVWDYLCLTPLVLFCQFTALALLVGRQERHPACKKLSAGLLLVTI